MGVAIAKGVLKTLGIAWQAEETYTVTVSGLSKAKADAVAATLKKDGLAVKVSKA